MIWRAPRALAADDPIDAFDCGKPALNEWLTRHALQSGASGSARAFVVMQESGARKRVAGYYSLAVGQVDTLDAPDRIRQGMGRYPIPVVLLARLAVDLRSQGHGVGVSMLRDAVMRALTVSEQAGVRALMTHPLDPDAARFYSRFGFVPSPAGEDMLLLLLKDAKRFVTPAGPRTSPRG